MSVIHPFLPREISGSFRPISDIRESYDYFVRPGVAGFHKQKGRAVADPPPANIARLARNGAAKLRDGAAAELLLIVTDRTTASRIRRVIGIVGERPWRL